MNIAEEIWDRYKEWIRAAFSSIGVGFTAVEISKEFLGDNNFVQTYIDNIWFLVLCAVIGLVLYGITQRKLTGKIGTKKIWIYKGNILKQKKPGTVVVGINRQMITDRSKVGKESIHRQLIDLYGENELQKVFTVESMSGNEADYFTQEIQSKSFLFLKMTDLTVKQAPIANKEEIKKVLSDLLKGQSNIRIEQGRLYIPVLGTGSAAVAIQKEDMIKVLVREYCEFLKDISDNGINRINNFCIIVHPNDWKELNRQELKKCLNSISNPCSYCKCK